jgi:DNA-binding NarL/FixJ family response regulator
VRYCEKRRGNMIQKNALAPLPIQVVLADDHDLVRSGIKALLSTVEGVQVIAEARNGIELLQLLESVKPDVVMTDISMPGMDGITAISEIHNRFPEVKVLVLSMYDTVDFVKRAVANGACGYLMKDAPPFELEQALRSVMATGSYFSAAVAQRLLQPSEPTVDDELTTRQVEILTLIAQGKSAKEIAFELGLSPKTVDVHRARIMERLRLNDIASLTRYAVRKGLVKA